MRELIQLILSIFFGLLPLWLILARRRNRRSREPVTPNRDSSEAESRQKAQQKRPWHTPLPWENETMLHVRNMSRERVAVDLPQEESQPPPASESKAPEESSSPISSMDEELTTYESEQSNFYDKNEQSNFYDKNEQSNFYDRSEQLKAPSPLLPAADTYNELQRAVLFAEILEAPRSLREWEPPS